MKLTQALKATFHLSQRYTLEKLGAFLDDELVSQALEESGIATVRKRRLPLEAVIWSVIGMGLYRKQSLRSIVSQLDLALPGKKQVIAPSAIVQARQRLGSESLKRLFKLISPYFYQTRQPSLPKWRDLNLFSVDGVVFRTEETPENAQVFGRSGHIAGKSTYPQVKVVCHMDLTSHQVINSELAPYGTSEMQLAKGLLETVQANSLTLFDKGFYSLDLLYQWQTATTQSHWLIPLRKGVKYEILQELGQGDKLIKLNTTPQSRKQNPALPESFCVRLLEKTEKGKQFQCITSLVDNEKYPANEVLSLYRHRWEIELGYREIKQYLLAQAYTLRSRKPEMVEQEIWGILLAYNLIRKAMVEAAECKGIAPNRLSFAGCSASVIAYFTGISLLSPGNLPKEYQSLLDELGCYELPDKRKRSYPRVVREKTLKYHIKKPVRGLN